MRILRKLEKTQGERRRRTSGVKFGGKGKLGLWGSEFWIYSTMHLSAAVLSAGGSVDMREKRAVYESPWWMKMARERGGCDQIRNEKALREFPEVAPSRQAMTRRVTGVL